MSGRLNPLLSQLSQIRQTSNFHVKNIKFIRRNPGQDIPKDIPAFGTVFTDHMLEVDWKDGQWSHPVIRPLEPLHLHPAAKVLHYSPTIFEGLKAFRGIDNEIRLFRIERNMARMVESARRAGLPEFCPLQLEHMIEDLVRKEREWVPCGDNTSLYIRPFLFGTDPSLGVNRSREAKLVVISCPVGPYYQSGWKPVSLYADPAFIRAAPGGVGAYKMGCNYAPGIFVTEKALAFGCYQALWLWGENEQLTEAGQSNVFVYWKNEVGEMELVTPPISGGLILPGVTRESILMLAREANEFKVTERYPTMNEIAKASKDGRLMEIFCSGTAAVVSPVNRIVYIDKSRHEPTIIDVKEQAGGPLCKKFLQSITDIQYGRADRPEWIRIVD